MIPLLPLLVAEPDPPPPDESGEVLTVTAPRSQRVGDQVASRILVLDAEQLQAMGAQNLGEALDTLPGVQVQDNYRGTEISLRGLDPQHTLILVDGQRLGGQVGGAVDLSRIPLEEVESVEVIKGPQSALYGSEAMGGVVRITTRKAEPVPSVAGQLAVGHTLEQGAPTADASVLLGGGIGDLGLKAEAGYHGAAPISDDEGFTTLEGFHQGELALSAHLSPQDRFTLDARSAYTARLIHGIDAGNGGAILDRRVATETLVNQASLSWSTPRALNTIHGSYSFYLDQYAVDQRKSSALDVYERSREDLGELSLLHERSTAIGVLSVGTDTLAQRLDADRLDSVGSRVRIAPFAQLEYRPTATLLVIPAARWELDSQFGRKLAPKLSLMWAPTQGPQLRVSYGQGFRAPSFSEQLLRFSNPSSGYRVEGNPELGPETSQGVDLELRQGLGPLTLSAAGWFTEIDDLIGVGPGEQTSTATVYQYVNIDQARSSGSEVAAVLELGALTADTSYTFNHTLDLSTGEALPGRPRHSATTRLAWTPVPAVDLGTQMRWVGARTVGTDLPLAAPYTQWDAWLMWQGPQDMRFRLGCENLLNTQDPSGLVLIRPREVVLSIDGHWRGA